MLLAAVSQRVVCWAAACCNCLLLLCSADLRAVWCGRPAVPCGKYLVFEGGAALFAVPHTMSAGPPSSAGGQGCSAQHSE